MAVTLVAVALNARIWGAMGVNVAVGGTGVFVAIGVLVRVKVAVGMVGVIVSVGVMLGVAVRDGVRVKVFVVVGVLVKVLVAVGVGVSLATGVAVGVLLGVRLGSTAMVGNITVSSCGWQAASSKKVRLISMAHKCFETITTPCLPR